MNLDTFDKISNILWGVIGLCAIAMVFCINNNIAMIICMAIAGSCYVLRNWLFSKFVEMNDSQEKES